MALTDDSDGCPPGSCNCGCSVNPCKPCPTITAAEVANAAHGGWSYAWCVLEADGAVTCWPWSSNLPPEAMQYAAERGLQSPAPMPYQDATAVSWANLEPQP
jgi:hypothetical protein